MTPWGRSCGQPRSSMSRLSSISALSPACTPSAPSRTLRDAVQEGQDCGRAPVQRRPLRAVHVADGEGTGDPARGEMLEQPQEERQVGLADALFIERQDESALLRLEDEVRIFDAFGDAFEAQRLADRVGAEERFQL